MEEEGLDRGESLLSNMEKKVVSGVSVEWHAFAACGVPMALLELDGAKYEKWRRGKKEWNNEVR
jgi:hypothetical protein